MESGILIAIIIITAAVIIGASVTVVPNSIYAATKGIQKHWRCVSSTDKTTFAAEGCYTGPDAKDIARDTKNDCKDSDLKCSSSKTAFGNNLFPH
ncbi:MAG TPA: hypothetical protein VE089_05805 [Nitrososphaeraceae archaeon]|jgi:hypothetical protein|nr:hypothetical protein [Nitrososphaeraceae archaeon]